jgi:hypothetical protein
MSNAAKKLGIMISARPGSGNFENGVNVALAGLKRGIDVYLYCIDRAVEGINDERLEKIKSSGGKIFACAYSMQERELAPPPACTLSGLTILSDLIAATDQFVSFN